MAPNLNILLALNAFKGTLTAAQANQAAAQGLRDAMSGNRTEVHIDVCSIADGGDGTLDVLVQAAPDKWQVLSTRVRGPLPASHVQARWAWNAGSRIALIEMAEAAGIRLIVPKARDPLIATTAGVGDLIAEACRAGARSILVGVGGSATLDGGFGALMALGFSLELPDGSRSQSFGDVEHAKRLRGPSHLQRGSLPHDGAIVVLCDTFIPLRGPGGAVSQYARQKFPPALEATHIEQACATLESRLDHWRNVTDGDAETPGAGAAGGLAYGLASCLGATLVPGAKRVLQEVGFDQRLSQCDWVITGEGHLDATTLLGKGPGEVLDRANAAQKPCAALCGRNSLSGPEAARFTLIEAEPGNKPASHDDAFALLRDTAHRLGKRLGNQ